MTQTPFRSTVRQISLTTLSLSHETYLELLHAFGTVECPSYPSNPKNMFCSVDKGIAAVEWLVERGLRTCGPIYIITALSLMLVVAYTFFFILLVEV